MRKCLQILLFCLLPFAAHARIIPLTLLFTSDLGGRLASEDSPGGLLQCATLIRDARARERNVLLIDCGDAVPGSFVSSFTKGKAVRDAMEFLKYDACIPGRRDLDCGMDVYENLFKTSSIPVLAANVRPAGFMRPLMVDEIDGIRVVVIGLACPVLDDCHLPDQLGSFQVSGSVDALADIMPSVRDMNPDVVILTTHQAWQEYDGEGSEINAIVRRFPEIDVILGGRRYQPDNRRLSDTTYYAQAGTGGNYLGRVELVYDNVTRTVREVSGGARPVTGSIPADPELKSLLALDIERAKDESGKVIACLKTPLAGDSLAAAAVMARCGADAVMLDDLPSRTFPAGPVTMEDVWDLVPHERNIAVISVTPPQMDGILEEEAKYIRKTARLNIKGLSWAQNDELEAGSRVDQLRMGDGSFIHPRKLLRTAAADVTLASSCGRRPHLRALTEDPSCRLEMTGVKMRDAVLEYLRANYPCAGKASAAKK
ncbi:MAG: bifunctional UDP-sugar hydrolase/5'-nucleotidase [Kiritimatiellia bacterium]